MKAAAPKSDQRKPTARQLTVFKKAIWDFYRTGKRDFEWRNTHDPYKIMVSELMLQQTQVSRVKEKFSLFMKHFPTVKSLAAASQPDVLKLWQGLGYNRRALNLKRACEEVTQKHKGKVPENLDALLSLPGIGPSTAGAIRNFAFNIPTAFIETNIRAVYLHFFFTDASSVSDTVINELIEKTMDRENPRDWFYALYDYGTMLKASLGTKRSQLHQKSAHYSRQSKFEGSNRQQRAAIVRCFVENQALALCLADIEAWLVDQSAGPKQKGMQIDQESIEKNLLALTKEGFLDENEGSGQRKEQQSTSWRLRP